MPLIRFSHLCICHEWKTFITLFLGTMKARKLKLGVNMDDWWMCHAYRNRGQGPITHRVMFLSRFLHLCVYLSSMKDFHNTFLGNYESQKAETWYKHGQHGGCILLTKKGAMGPQLTVMFLSRFSHLYIYLSSMKDFWNTFLGNYES